MRFSTAGLLPFPLLLLLVSAPALTACQTDSPAKPTAQAAAPPEPPALPTRQEAAMQCWTSVDKAHKDLSLDKRADIVTKCIENKVNPGQAPAAAPKPPKAKT